MFLVITWEDPTLAVPLAQLQPTQPNKATGPTVADWHYWVDNGYEF